jgi:hypothetical protein
MEEEDKMNRTTSSGVVALLAIGGFVAWRYRFQLQRFFESRGVSLPLQTGNLSDTIRSGVAKVTGKIEHGRNQVDQSFEESSKRNVI